MQKPSDPCGFVVRITGVMYIFRALVALRGRVLRFIQGREVIIVGIRLLVGLIASRGYTLLMLIEVV
jgi:hypothetical protein